MPSHLCSTIHSFIILPSASTPPQVLFPSGFLTSTTYTFFFSPIHAWTPHPLCYHPNIWHGVLQNAKHSIKQFTSCSCCFLPLRPQMPKAPFSSALTPCSSFDANDNFHTPFSSVSAMCHLLPQHWSENLGRIHSIYNEMCYNVWIQRTTCHNHLWSAKV